MAKGSHGGKGSKPRPIQDKEAFDRNWDRIFGSRTENDCSTGENDTGHETGHQSGLSRFVHAPEADRERIGEEVAERSIERQLRNVGGKEAKEKPNDSQI